LVRAEAAALDDPVSDRDDDHPVMHTPSTFEEAPEHF
jgi:hypothetical protein